MEKKSSNNKLILKKQNDKYSIYLSIKDKSSTRLVSSGISLNYRSEFDVKSQKIIFNKKLKNNTFNELDIENQNIKLINFINKQRLINDQNEDNIYSKVLNIYNVYKLNQQFGTAKRMLTLLNFFKQKKFNNLKLKNLNHLIIEEFYLDCLSKNNTNNTIKSKIKIFKTVIKKILLNENETEITILDLFKNIRVRESEPKLRYLSDQEITNLFETYFRNSIILTPHEKEVLRMFLFGILSGLRFRDLINLKIEDVNFNEKLINLVNSKSQINQHIHLNSTALKLLNSFNNSFFVFNFLNINDLIKTKELLHIKYESLNASCNRSLKKIALKTKINNKVSFHYSRHSCGTQLLNRGVDIQIISRVLGHANIRQTETYLKVNNNLKINALNKLDDLYEEMILNHQTKTN